MWSHHTNDDLSNRKRKPVWALGMSVVFNSCQRLLNFETDHLWAHHTHADLSNKTRKATICGHITRENRQMNCNWAAFLTAQFCSPERDPLDAAPSPQRCTSVCPPLPVVLLRVLSFFSCSCLLHIGGVLLPVAADVTGQCTCRV